MTASKVAALVGESARTVAGLRKHAGAIARAGGEIVAALRRGRKVLTAGNGGSAAEAMHMAEELVGRFRSNRRALPAVALTADCTALTCIGNDFGYDEVFARQVEALGQRGDCLVLFSTSGRAANLSRAVAAARDAGVKTIGLLGRDGGPLAGKTDHEIIVSGSATERIQEAHLVIVHLLLEAIEQAFPAPGQRKTP